jgi:hypothetical protein
MKYEAIPRVFRLDTARLAEDAEKYATLAATRHAELHPTDGFPPHVFLLQDYETDNPLDDLERFCTKCAGSVRVLYERRGLEAWQCHCLCSRCPKPTRRRGCKHDSFEADREPGCSVWDDITTDENHALRRTACMHWWDVTGEEYDSDYLSE